MREKYFMGICLSCKEKKEEKSSNINQENLLSFNILKSTYSLFLVIFQVSGYDDEIVKAYVDTIETKLFKMEFDELAFNDKYDEVVADMEYSSLDSVYQVHDQEAYYQGFYYLKFAEFRRAVVDAYRTEENNTYSTIKTTYPNYEFLDIINDYPQLKDSLLHIFCTDFDSLMIINGPFDPEDPFYTDSIDVRMINSLVSLIAEEDFSSTAALKIKNAEIQHNIQNISSLRKFALPVLEELRSDSISGGVAMYVIYSMAPHFYEGDKIRQAVKEAYYLQKGIVTVPVATTEFLENISSISVQLKGFVIEDGMAEVTERGITWATYYNPTTEDNLEPSGAGTGEYSITLYGLSPGTTYYARSYAQNSAGISYGNCIQFMAGTTGIEEMIYPDMDFKAFPNPASENVTISFHIEKTESTHFSIIDMSGRVVLERNFDNLDQGENLIQLNISALESGIYNCKLTDNKTKSISQKLIVTH